MTGPVGPLFRPWLHGPTGLVGKAEMGSVAGFVWKVLRALDGGFESDEVTHEVAFAAYRFRRADADQLFDQDRPITESPGLPVLPYCAVSKILPASLSGSRSVLVNLSM